MWPSRNSWFGKSRPDKFVHRITWNESEVSYEELRNSLLTLSLATFAFAGPGQQDTYARLQAAGVVMNEIMAAPDKAIPEEVLHGAKCIAVVPDMAKGAFIVGGEHGRGVVTCRHAHG